MENNKKISISLNTVILIGVFILVLLLIPIGLIIYNNSKNNTEPISDIQTNSTNDSTLVSDDTSPVTNATTNTTTVANTTTNTSTTKNTTTNSSVNTTNTTTNNTTNSTSTDSSNSSSNNSTIAKTSTKYNPLSVGEWGTASKSSDGSNVVDVPVKVTNVIRGTAAAQKVKDFCSSGSFYKYSEPKEGMEWAVVEYTVDLTNIASSGSSGKAISVDHKITGTGDNNSIVYNGGTYILSTMNLSPRLY